MDTKEKINLITGNLEEVIGGDELKSLINDKEELRHYIGFEISGKLHIGSGLMTAYKIKDLIDAGVSCRLFLADWHAWINNKLGGNHEVIKKIAVGYFKEALIASYMCVGGDPKDLKFVLGSDLYHHNDAYWQTLIDVSKNTTLGRMQKGVTIMGRKEGDSLNFAMLIYPSMQVSDIFIQKVNIAHSGLDQRKAHVIAREIAMKLQISPLLNKEKEKIKPICLHHHLILGLKKPSLWPVPKDKLRELWSDLKMSKSIPDSAVFITDSPEEIMRKVSKAFCPEKEIKFNPILDWAKHLLFVKKDFELLIEREEKFGGNIVYNTYKDLEKDFERGSLHPVDLKKAVGERIVELLGPARKHFEKPSVKKMKEEMEKLIITR